MKSLFKRYSLLGSIFITGGAVLIVEVTATRILSPYFGNTLYTVSSVIGVVLAALSLGYYIGGTLSDKYPSQKLFFTIIILSGFNVFILKLLIYYLLPRLAYNLSLISGPLISSLFLFFIPSFLLGMLSPFAIKLQHLNLPKERVGKTAGEIFFWSTLGSIVGSIGAGFYLIPHFGSDQIITVVALTLAFLGLTGLVLTGEKNKKIILMIIAGIGIFSLTQNFQDKKNFLYSHDGVYEKISIYDGIYNSRPTRFFQQDRSSSGAMFLDSDELVYDYTKYFRLYRLLEKSPERVLVLGGGAYSIPKAILKELPKASIDVVEIEPRLYDLAKKYFNLSENPRLKNFVSDGRRFLHDSSKGYDLIFSDVYYSFLSVPVHFTTKEFFLLANKKLSQDGIFIANFIGDLKESRASLILSLIKTFRSAFPNSYFFALDSPNSRQMQNIIFLGINSNKKLSLNKIKTFKDEIISNLDVKLVDFSQIDLKLNSVLTDNYAPIEYLTAQLLKRTLEKKALVFDSERALEYIRKQLSFGPRHLSNQGHKKTQDFLFSELKTLSEEVIKQKWEHESARGEKYSLANIIGRFNAQEKRRIILASHYDTKRFADKDKKRPDEPVPGANDGASGIAVLLETVQFLANTDTLPAVGVDIVFFDGEESEEDLSRTAWTPLGSSHFAQKIEDIYPDDKPEAGIIVDMVCDKELKIEKEISSMTNAPRQFERFWDLGYRISPSSFSGKARYEIQDDHTALNKIGIPSFLIIDFEYPYFHTTEDTFDKCDENSLKIVGETLLSYIYSL